MKFLVDESVEYAVVIFLREKGFDVASIAETSASIDDEAVLEMAFKQHRILITNDKDFGELIYRHKLTHVGVILLRLPREDAESKIESLSELFKRYGKKLPGAFTVVTEREIRIRQQIN